MVDKFKEARELLEQLTGAREFSKTFHPSHAAQRVLVLLGEIEAGWAALVAGHGAANEQELFEANAKLERIARIVAPDLGDLIASAHAHAAAKPRGAHPPSCCNVHEGRRWICDLHMGHEPPHRNADNVWLDPQPGCTCGAVFHLGAWVSPLDGGSYIHHSPCALAPDPPMAYKRPEPDGSKFRTVASGDPLKLTKGDS